jgi:hypothetical protein
MERVPFETMKMHKQVLRFAQDDKSQSVVEAVSRAVDHGTVFHPKP